MPRRSLAGRIAAALALTAAGCAAVTAFAVRWLSPLLAALVAVILALPVLLWLAQRVTQPWVRVLRAVRDGIVSLRDHDFSISVGSTRDLELNALTDAYNSLGDLLRRERLDLYQRELLLDTVIQSTPQCMVLNDDGGRVVYSNVAARQLLHGGRKLEGLAFTAIRRRRRHALHHDRRRRAAGVPPVAARLSAERPPAPPGAPEAADTRTGRAGSHGVEEGHPRHRP
jgi:two-component system nitrogen regulation sensor histidine kinase NtrY